MKWLDQFPQKNTDIGPRKQVAIQVISIDTPVSPNPDRIMWKLDGVRLPKLLDQVREIDSFRTNHRARRLSVLSAFITMLPG
jgi:hypothetical protein